MPSRAFGNAARYGFNGKERDKDIHSLTAYDYGFRIYNPAIGRFLSVDPLTNKYPWYTPYQFAGNNPITFVDIDGAEPTLSYIQIAAFDCIESSFSNIDYIRGIRGEHLMGSFPDERSDFERALVQYTPLSLFQGTTDSYIAQAINFGNAVGSVVYDYTAFQKGFENEEITNYVEARVPEMMGHSVYLRISSNTEVGEAVFANLRSSNELKDLSDAEIRGYIDKKKIVFEPGKDYSFLFWKAVDKNAGPPILLMQEPLTMPMPITPSVPILLTPVNGESSVNTKDGSTIISTVAISQELSATFTPELVQMSKQKTQNPDDGYGTTEELAARRQELKDYLSKRNGKADTESKAMKKKIEKNEKILGERNKQKRNSN